MGILQNHIPSVEETDALEQQRAVIAPESAPASGFGKFMKKTRAYVAGGMMLVSPVLGSCVQADGREGSEQGGGVAAENTSETMSLAERTVQLNYAGDSWYFTGKYPQDFRLVVEVDGKQVFDEEVAPVNGSFEVSGPANATAHQVKARAYNPDAQDMSSFEIPIKPDKKTKGMYGVGVFNNKVEYPAD